MNPVTRYELPPEGITLLGYVVRRMHKTAWLTPIKDLLSQGKTTETLARVATYAVVASTSFGPAYYQPRFNAVGERISEPDPETGATVWAELKASSPTYKISTPSRFSTAIFSAAMKTLQALPSVCAASACPRPPNSISAPMPTKPT